MREDCAICIVTWSQGKVWLDQLINSLDTPYPVVFIVNNSNDADSIWLEELKLRGNVISLVEDHYEMGAIRAMHNLTEYSQFFLLQDTFEILDNSIFYKLFEEEPYKDRSVQYGRHFQMYLGKFKREILDRFSSSNTWPPMPKTKGDSIWLEEHFTKKYKAFDPATIEFNHNFADQGGKQEEHFGRNNLVIEDQYLRKWKGTWM